MEDEQRSELVEECHVLVGISERENRHFCQQKWGVVVEQNHSGVFLSSVEN